MNDITYHSEEKWWACSAERIQEKFDQLCSEICKVRKRQLIIRRIRYWLTIYVSYFKGTLGNFKGC